MTTLDSTPAEKPERRGFLRGRAWNDVQPALASQKITVSFGTADATA